MRAIECGKVQWLESAVRRQDSEPNDKPDSGSTATPFPLKIPNLYNQKQRRLDISTWLDQLPEYVVVESICLLTTHLASLISKQFGCRSLLVYFAF